MKFPEQQITMNNKISTPKKRKRKKKEKNTHTHTSKNKGECYLGTSYLDFFGHNHIKNLLQRFEEPMHIYRHFTFVQVKYQCHKVVTNTSLLAPALQDNFFIYFK